MDALGEAQQVRELIGRCLAGDRDAAARFQQTYGELIYGFPLRVYRTPPEEAGDFYLFAFEDGRIFRRLRTFEGRAPFRAYLLGSVLDHLVLEWKRGAKDIETVPMEEIGELPAPQELHGEVLGEPNEDVMNAALLEQMLAGVEPSKAVVLKLLHVEDYDLSVDEVRYLAQQSGRSVAEVVVAVDGLRGSVREREANLKSVEDSLDAVQAWIELYQRRLRRIAEDLSSLPPTSMAAARLREEQTELERKVQRRQAQRAKILARGRRRKVTAPYKEIAALLNTTVGNVGSQVARLRKELAAQAGLSGQGSGLGGGND